MKIEAGEQARKTMIRIYLVHEMELINNVICTALESQTDIKVVGSTTSVSQAHQDIKNGAVDVVLASNRLPEQGPIRLLRKLREDSLDINLIVIGMTETRQQVLHFLEQGASGYVTKDSTIDDMVAAIRLANQGKVEVPPEINTAIIHRLREYSRIFMRLETSVLESAQLTDRELEVLDLLGQNYTNTQIADTLVIQVGTVKNHVHSILSKLNVSSRREAAHYLALLD